MLHDCVLFVGDRPSASQNLSLDVPFVGARSYKTLLEWMYRMDVDVRRVLMVNAYTVSGDRNPNLRPEIYSCLKVVTLGDAAAQAVAEEFPELRFFRLPHPSGLNRKLNDKTELAQALSRCKRFIYKK